MRAFLDDACCFVQSISPAIESAPLQVYYSGLVFAPRNSIIRNAFMRIIPRWPQINSPLQLEWNEDVLLGKHDGPVNTICVSPNNCLLASGSSDKSIKIWDLSRGSCLRTLRGHQGPVSTTIFSPDGMWLASGSSEAIRIWDIRSGECLRSLYGHNGSIRLLSFLKEGQSLVSYSFDRAVKTWCVQTGRCIGSLETTHAACSSAFSSDGNQIALGLFDDSGIEIWNIVAKKCQSVIKGHSMGGHGNSVRALAFSESGSQLASYSFDRTIKIWDTATSHCARTLVMDDMIYSVAFSRHGRSIILGLASNDGTTKIYDIGKERISRTIRGHDGPVCNAILLADAKRLISASFDGTIKLWNVESMQHSNNDHETTGDFRSLVLSPGAQFFASISDHDSNIRMSETGNGGNVYALRSNGTSPSAIAFSADSQWLASGFTDGTIRIWDSFGRRCVLTLAGETGPARAVAFSVDLQYLVGGTAQDVKVWSLRQGTCMRTFKGHFGSVAAATFSPNTKWIASGSSDKTIRVWDLALDACVATLTGHTDSICSLSYSYSGRRLASASFDATIRIWDASTATCLHTIDGHRPSLQISFCNTSDTLLSTRYGRLDVGNFLDAQQSEAFRQDVSLSGWGISSDSEWVTKDGKVVLWLPLQYRPKHFASTGSTMVFGCSGGRTLRLQFQ